MPVSESGAECSETFWRLDPPDGRENPMWRAPRIHRKLLLPGFEISELTVSPIQPGRLAEIGTVYSHGGFAGYRSHAVDRICVQ